ncbi:MAG: twin-arginine translocation signal domain-containing protein [Candidatus Woesearchaeota archaeon]
MTLSRRDFLKYTTALMAGTAIGLNPFTAEAREGTLEDNIFTANDGTEIDVTHLGRKTWNFQQKKVLEKCGKEWKTAEYRDIGNLYERFQKRLISNPELSPLIKALNFALNIGSTKKRWYNEYMELFKENIDFMKEFDTQYTNNPYTKMESGSAYDNIKVVTQGQHIYLFKESITLARKLPQELLFDEGLSGMVKTEKDVLKEAIYASAIRGPPNHPVTWNHEANIRGPPYDTAKKFLEMALEDYPEDPSFNREYKWVSNHL